MDFGIHMHVKSTSVISDRYTFRFLTSSRNVMPNTPAPASASQPHVLLLGFFSPAEITCFAPGQAAEAERKTESSAGGLSYKHDLT